MNATEKIHLAKITSAIYDQNIAIIGFIPIVGGFHPGIWCFDIAALTSIIWLVLHSKEKRSH